jgi:hypothetical protein
MEEDACSCTRKQSATSQKDDSLSLKVGESTGAKTMHTLRNSKSLILEKANMETMHTLRSNIDGQGLKRDD